MKKHLAALCVVGLTLSGVTTVMATNSQNVKAQSQGTAVDILSHDQAKAIVLDYIPGAMLQTIQLESEDGCLVYEMKLIKGSIYYEVEIDARTGKIYQYEINGIPQQTSKNATHVDSPTITWQQAKDIALKKIPGAKSTKLELDTSDGLLVYDIDLIKDNVEYDLEISAETGEIVKYKVDRDYLTKAEVATSNPKVTWEQAKKIALEKVPNGTTTKLKLDRENGRLIYEIEIIKNNQEHDLEIDATTGQIVKYEIDDVKQTLPASSSSVVINQNAQTAQVATNNKLLTHEEVKQIALKRVPGAIVKEIELDKENGKTVYEIELIKDNVEYDLEIDAYTGEIYKCKID